MSRRNCTQWAVSESVSINKSSITQIVRTHRYVDLINYEHQSNGQSQKL